MSPLELKIIDACGREGFVVWLNKPGKVPVVFEKIDRGYRFTLETADVLVDGNVGTHCVVIDVASAETYDNIKKQLTAIYDEEHDETERSVLWELMIR